MRYRYLTYLSYFSIMSYGISLTIIGPALAPIRDYFAVTEGEVGLLFTFLSIGFLAVVLFGGSIIDKYGLKLVSSVGQLLLLLGAVLFASSKTFTLGIIAFSIIGVAGGMIEIATNTVISFLYKNSRASSLNLLHLFFGIGALIGPLFSGYLLDVGMKWQIIYIGLFLFSLVVFITLLFSNFPKMDGFDKVDLSILSKILKNKYTVLLGVAMLCYVGAEMGTSSWVVVYMENTLKIRKIVASSFLSYFWLAMTCGRLFCFYLGKRIKETNLLLLLSASAIFFYIVFLLSTEVILVALSLALVGFSFSGIFPTIIALGSNKFPQALGTITSTILVSAGLGFMIFPWIVGMITEAYSLNIGMFFLLILIVLLTILTWILRGNFSRK